MGFILQSEIPITLNQSHKAKYMTKWHVTGKVIVNLFLSFSMHSLNRYYLHFFTFPMFSYKGCPPGFDYLPEVGSCYKVISKTMNWDDATKKCRQVKPGVHLAAITSQQENDAIVRYLRLKISGK